MDTFLSLLTAQTLTTVFLAVVLWSLYAQFRQGFNRWWAWAWTSSAVFLALCRIALLLTTEPMRLPVGTALIVTLTGFITAPLLALAPSASSLRTCRSAGGGRTRGALALRLTFGASHLWADPVAGFSFRHGVRTAALGSVLLLCAWVFRADAGNTVVGRCHHQWMLSRPRAQSVRLRRDVAARGSVPALGGRAAEELLLSAANLISLDIAITAGSASA